MAEIQLKLVLAKKGAESYKGYLIQAQLVPEVQTMYMTLSLSLFWLASLSKIPLYVMVEWPLTCQAYIINTT